MGMCEIIRPKCRSCDTGYWFGVKLCGVKPEPRRPWKKIDEKVVEAGEDLPDFCGDFAKMKIVSYRIPKQVETMRWRVCNNPKCVSNTGVGYIGRAIQIEE